MARIEVCDVGPRDGLQNEAVTLPVAVRVELCRRLAAAGVTHIEAASFVNPKLVPQMADAEAVVAGLPRERDVSWSGLVLNEQGYERALATGLREVHYAFGVTDSFSQRNQGISVDEGIAIAHRLVERAREDSVRITVTLSVAFGCPFEGRVEPARVLGVVEEVAAQPPDAIVLADTIGVGVPSQVRELVAGVRHTGTAAGAHFHNTRNTGFANALAALEAGVELLDASVGGAGGCPFAPRATGNIATEDLVYLLHGMGYETGINLQKLIEVATWLSSQLGRELPGQVSRAGVFEPVAG